MGIVLSSRKVVKTSVVVIHHIEGMVIVRTPPVRHYFNAHRNTQRTHGIHGQVGIVFAKPELDVEQTGRTDGGRSDGRQGYVDRQTYQAVVDGNTSLACRTDAVRQQVAERFLIERPPVLQQLVVQTVRQYPFAELIQCQVTVPRLAPYLESTVDAPYQLFRREVFHIPVTTQPGSLITGSTTICFIDGRNVILLLTNLIHRIDERIKFVHHFPCHRITVRHVLYQETGSPILPLIVLIMLQHLLQLLAVLTGQVHHRIQTDLSHAACQTQQYPYRHSYLPYHHSMLFKFLSNKAPKSCPGSKNIHFKDDLSRISTTIG